MATGAPQIDLTAQMCSFLLRGYVAAMNETRFSPDDRLKWRMDLESFVLNYGTNALKELQRAFNVSIQEDSSYAAEWFVAFIASRDENWLRETSLSVIESFWRGLRDNRIRRPAIDLILKVEVAIDPSASSAFGSQLISLFREIQPDPFEKELRPDSRLIFDCLVKRIKLTPDSVFPKPSGSLARYSLQVLRYCFRNRFDKLTISDAKHIISMAGDLTFSTRQRLLSLAVG